MYELLKGKHEREDTGKAYDEDEINEQIKEILQKIAHYDMDIEVIRKWIWHDGNYSRNHKGETDLNDIRLKYGVREVKLRQGKRAIKG